MPHIVRPWSTQAAGAPGSARVPHVWASRRTDDHVYGAPIDRDAGPLRGGARHHAAARLVRPVGGAASPRPTSGSALGVGRAWVLLVPAIVAVAWFFAAGAEVLAYLILILGAPAMVGLTAIGWGLSRSRLRDGAALACAGVVVVVVLAGAVAQLRKGPHVPASVQRQLPTEESFGNLCPDASTPKDLERDLHRKAEVLLRELDENPQHTVTRTAVLLGRRRLRARGHHDPAARAGAARRPRERRPGLRPRAQAATARRVVGTTGPIRLRPAV